MHAPHDSTAPAPRTAARSFVSALALLLAASLVAGCATYRPPAEREPRQTTRDKTVKGASVGAVAGATAAVLLGEREAEEILTGAAIGAAVGAGVGVYMDRQEEKLARIPGTTVERVSEDTLLVHFASDILFDVDSWALGGGARSTLDEVGSVLLEYPKTAVVIQGHTDSTGSEMHNQQLSERRADAVQNHLVARGVDPGRMSALGYGESYPVASNDSESGKQQNRRVDILLKAKAR
jgi:outer membrane protein OmpA-like peptidoglycan-associated protein